MSLFDTRWPDLGRFWTIANALSLARGVLVVPIAVLIWVDGPLSWLAGLVVLAILTDWLDGRVARWTRTVSDWGKVIDPIADKFAALMTVSALTFRAAEPSLPLWFFGLVIGRDVCILLASAFIVRRSGRIVVSAWVGKAATMWLALLVLAAVLKADPPVFEACLWMAAGLLVFSLVVYAVRYFAALRTPGRATRRSAVLALGADGADGAAARQNAVQDAGRGPSGQEPAAEDASEKGGGAEQATHEAGATDAAAPEGSAPSAEPPR
jgi:CDP-diacylglycerol--glycerol-3-phosphate 3-phosphatidyltransferase